MKKPASAGAHGLSKIVASRADNFGYAADQSAFQVSVLARRYGLSPSVAATIAALAFTTAETWRSAR